MNFFRRSQVAPSQASTQPIATEVFNAGTGNEVQVGVQEPSILADIVPMSRLERVRATARHMGSRIFPSNIDYTPTASSEMANNLFEPARPDYSRMAEDDRIERALRNISAERGAAFTTESNIRGAVNANMGSHPLMENLRDMNRALSYRDNNQTHFQRRQAQDRADALNARITRETREQFNDQNPSLMRQMNERNRRISQNTAELNRTTGVLREMRANEIPVTANNVTRFTRGQINATVRTNPLMEGKGAISFRGDQLR